MPTALQLRNGVAALAALADRDLAALWRLVKTAEQAKAALNDVLPALIDKYGLAAASVAADWYDDLRDEVGARGRFSAILADLDDMGAAELAGWGISPLFRPDPDWAAAQTLVAGGLQRRIANAARSTITFSSVQDPAAAGWKRRGAGGCGFCRTLIGYDRTYSEASADFKSHDHCRCVAYPAFT